MKTSHFITVIYILATICLCAIVYVFVDSKSTVAKSNTPEGYTYWEEVSGTSEQTYHLITSSDNTNANQNDNHTNSATTNNETTSTDEIYYQTPEDDSVDTSAPNKDTPISSSSSKPTTNKPTTNKPQEYTGIVNLNTASFDQLCSLNGIGEVLAQRIIDYRKTHNGFKTVNEIMNVSGIGEKKLAAIKNRITV